MRMLTEIPAHPIGAVADPAGHLAVGIEQEPRILQPAEAEAEIRRLHGDRGRIRVVAAHHRARDAAPRIVETQIDQIGIEHQQDIGVGNDLVAVAGVEVDRAVAVVDLPQIRAGGVGRPLRNGVGRGQIEHRIGGSGIGVEIGPGDRPAAQPDLRPGLEIPGIEGAAAPAPVIGRPAEIAQPRDEGVVIVEPDILAGIEILRDRRDLEAAGLQQHDPAPGGGERARQGDPCGPGPGNADIEDGGREITVLGVLEDHGAEARTPSLNMY